MITSGQEIKRLCLEKNLITPFSEKNLRNSSYDLTVGDEIYCGNSETDNLRIRTTYLAKNDSFKIPAYGFAYILCNENIKLDYCMTARVSLRMSLIYKGLILTVQPPFDPNYNGKVIVLLHNMSTEPIYLKRGERIVTIEFSYVYGATPSPTSEIFDQPSVASLQEKIKSEMKSGLNELIVKNQKNSQKHRGLVTIVITTLSIFAAITLGMSPMIGTYLEKRLDSKYASEIESLKTEIYKLNRELEQQSTKLNEYNHNLQKAVRD